ncbi:unnamed protein product [Citrullus colocynthis]|uniref:Uncharacterized protein n=1 Tax=Citrullus colocynthis TaxID=252529 RepID=A0ABP0XLS2_9ROSI
MGHFSPSVEMLEFVNVGNLVTLVFADLTRNIALVEEDLGASSRGEKQDGSFDDDIPIALLGKGKQHSVDSFYQYLH